MSPTASGRPIVNFGPRALQTAQDEVQAEADEQHGEYDGLRLDERAVGGGFGHAGGPQRMLDRETAPFAAGGTP